MDQKDQRRIMLISNSFSHGREYLAHCADALRTFLGSVRELVFIPYALKDWDRYTQIAHDGFAKFGISIRGIHKYPTDVEGIEAAEAIFIGGGNTFRLLRALHDRHLIEPIRFRALRGMPYLGASAGANVACPTIKTTNDMPIVMPASLDALDLVPFQINPHFIDFDPNSTHMGETREKRIAEFHEENDTPVIGLREGSWIIVDGRDVRLEGATGAKTFCPNAPPEEWSSCIHKPM